MLDAARFASDGPEVVLGGDDVAVLIRSDDVAHIDDAQTAIFGALGDVFTVTSVRNGFVGGGFSAGPGSRSRWRSRPGSPAPS